MNDRPRPNHKRRQPRQLGSALALVLRRLLPPPSRAYELLELTTHERLDLYRLASLSRIEALSYDLSLARHEHPETIAVPARAELGKGGAAR